MVPEKCVIINKKGASRVAAGHLWVFRGDLDSVKNVSGGEVATVLDMKGRFVAKAFYSAQSAIALRVLSRDDVPINDRFWSDRIVKAHSLRQALKINSNAFRVVYGDSDLLSSIIVDRFGDYLVLQTLSQGAESVKQTLVNILVELLSPKGILERNDAKVRAREGLASSVRVLYGEVPASVEIFEDAVKFQADLHSGQKTGFFLDQRENRLAVASYATGRVLDCFSYAGGFALHAARNANHVTAVDISSEAIAQGRKNADLNQISNVEFIPANCFDLLHEYDDQKLQFDMVILDPPAFAKNKKAVEAAMGGYKEINRRAIKLLASGGVLVTCSCSYHLSEQLFWQVLYAAAADAGRCLQIIEKRTQARDHPILLSVPETYYLKCFVLRVI